MKRMFLGWVAAGIMAVPMSAQALLVTVDGQAYDVKTVTGTFNALQLDLVTQPFWGDGTLAEALAGSVKGGLGFPNGTGTGGPLFAYARSGALPRSVDTWRWSSLGGGDFGLRSNSLPDGTPFTWATASPVPDPPALYLLGLGLAGLLGLGKRRRTQAAPI